MTNGSNNRTVQIERPDEMGKVFTELTITNRADQIRAEDGTISPEQVRSVTLKNVLVDTGATTLCLPSTAIAQLGLRLLRENASLFAGDPALTAGSSMLLLPLALVRREFFRMPKSI